MTKPSGGSRAASLMGTVSGFVIPAVGFVIRDGSFGIRHGDGRE